MNSLTEWSWRKPAASQSGTGILPVNGRRHTIACLGALAPSPRVHPVFRHKIRQENAIRGNLALRMVHFIAMGHNLSARAGLNKQGYLVGGKGGDGQKRPLIPMYRGSRG